MSEPISSCPNFLSQNPVQFSDLAESEPYPGDQILPDPLLGTGFFIDADQKCDTEPATRTNREPELEKAAVETNTTTAPEAAEPLEVTPISQWPPKRPVEEMAERPDWLPEDWKIEVRVRTSGATAGVADRYFFAPSGEKFRSKIEVLHFLETGSRRKKKLKSDADATPSENPSGSKKKKSTPNVGNISGSKFDFRSPQQSSHPGTGR